MEDGNNTIVFVSASDLAALTNRTPQRISRLVADRENGFPNPVLPATSVSINGNPAWSLDTVVPALTRAGYTLSAPLIADLREKRSAPASTVPVGINEAAEALGISADTMRKRSKRGSAAPILFRFGREKVWDLDTLVATTLAHGMTVNDDAVSKWRERNGGATKLARREVVHVLVVRSTVPTALDDAVAAQKIAGQVRAVLALGEPLDEDGVRVLGVEVQPSS
ncbi:hypothetical protein [Catenulispora pinisilvae]|uniref:hypothetical protein n=1 Tax=Catenulispora pinisilvae TaxID=2705253 RepID=UPI00189220C6|nr:hypothetical protein [Catenulispora pinisilvae]